VSWWYDAKNNVVLQSDTPPPGYIADSTTGHQAGNSTVWGPFPTQAYAQQVQQMLGATNQALQSPLQSLTGGFLSQLGEWVMRIGEVVLGIVVIGIAANAMIKKAGSD